jgi:Flp pilus assembly pilin Flp
MKDLPAKLRGWSKPEAGACLVGYGLLIASITLVLMMAMVFWKSAQY